MNKVELAKMEGRIVRLRPEPREVDGSGKDLGPYDYSYKIEKASPEGLGLVEPSDADARPKRFRLPSDSILEYRTDAERDGRGLLLLKSQVFLQGDQVFVEPVHPLSKTARTPGPTREYVAREYRERKGPARPVDRASEVMLALEVLAALERVRVYHEVRQHHTPGVVAASHHSKTGAHLWRAMQMTELRNDYDRQLGRLVEARDALFGVQAKAVAVWGAEAKDPLKRVFGIIDALGIASAHYWPTAIHRAKVLDARMMPTTSSDPSFPQPGILFGIRADEAGRFFEEAVTAAEAWYRERTIATES